MGKKKKEWKLVERYGVKKYGCGLRAGQRVRLLRDLIVRNHKGQRVEPIHKAGEIWNVLPGSQDDPRTVWLRRTDGARHTWDDSPDFFSYFEIVEE